MPRTAVLYGIHGNATALQAMAEVQALDSLCKPCRDQMVMKIRHQ